MMCEIESTPSTLIFVGKNSADGYRWVAKHENIIFYLYADKPIRLIKYCQDFEKKTTIECTDIYDAIFKIGICTNRQPLFRYDGDTPSNYMA